MSEPFWRGILFHSREDSLTDRSKEFTGTLVPLPPAESASS